jgi:hypothetical protein
MLEYHIRTLYYKYRLQKSLFNTLNHIKIKSIVYYHIKIFEQNFLDLARITHISKIIMLGSTISLNHFKIMYGNTAI